MLKSGKCGGLSDTSQGCWWVGILEMLVLLRERHIYEVVDNNKIMKESIKY
jgi:hypothetical protein